MKECPHKHIVCHNIISVIHSVVCHFAIAVISCEVMICIPLFFFMFCVTVFYYQFIVNCFKAALGKVTVCVSHLIQWPR